MPLTYDELLIHLREMLDLCDGHGQGYVVERDGRRVTILTVVRDVMCEAAGADPATVRTDPETICGAIEESRSARAALAEWLDKAAPVEEDRPGTPTWRLQRLRSGLRRFREGCGDE